MFSALFSALISGAARLITIAPQDMPSAEGSIILAERLTTVTNNRATERGEWSLDLCTVVTVKLPGLYVVLKEQEVLVLLPVLLLLLVFDKLPI